MIEERMPCLYDTENDLVARIGNTIVRYDGKPVLVIVESKTSLYLKHPVSHDTLYSYIKPSDPLLDISCPELGYMNLAIPGKEPRNDVVYVERLPRRQFHQGLLNGQLSYSSLSGEPHRVPGYPYGLYLESDGFYGMLIDKYPSLDEAFDILEAEEVKTPGGKTISVKQLALSKDVALEKTKSGVYQVYFKCDQIGWCTNEKRVVNVRSHEEGWIVSKYLQQFKWKVI